MSRITNKTATEHGPQTYAYNTLVHRKTKLSSFSLVLTLQPHGPATPSTRPMPLDVEHVNLAMALLTRLICLAAELKRMADTNLRQAQRGYKWTATNRSALNQHLLQWLCFRQTSTTVQTGAERSAAENYSTLCPPRLGKYRIVGVGPEVVHITQAESKIPPA